MPASRSSQRGASDQGAYRGSSGRAAYRGGAARVPEPTAEFDEPARPAARISGRAQVGGGRYAGNRPPARQGRPAGPDGPDGPHGPGYGGEYGQPRRGPRPRWGRIAMVAAVLLIVLGLLAGIGAWAYVSSVNSEIDRTDPFSALTNGRPAKTVDGALNILVVGSDSRDPDAPLDKANSWRADTIILMHIPSSHDKAYLISVPRDLYVPVPKDPQSGCDSGSRNKINAAFAFGGLPLAVKTVECFTDVRMDHVIAIDFAGFKDVVNALGGVDLKIDRTITSIHKPYRKFVKGTRHLNGAEALDWIRQRKQFPDGDFARMRHQQEFLKALMDKAASSGTLTNPSKLNGFLKATAKAVTVDKGFSLVDMALQFRNLRGNNLVFLTNPNKGSDTIDGQSVVVSDREKALALYQAITADKMADWAKENISPSPSADAQNSGG